MKAIRVHEFGGPENLRLEEVPVPQPGPGQVLVTIAAIGVNPLETYLRGGSNPALPLPYTPGTDTAGLIAAVGENAGRWQVGSRVYTTGTVTGAYAEGALVSTETLRPLPETLTFAQGAAIGIPYATAWRALMQRAAAKAGETVLIHGASGAVGQAATQMAAAHGLRVLGTAGTAEGLALVRKNGAAQAFDHRAPDYLAEITACTGGKGPDIILEMLSNVNLAKDAALIAKRGRIIVIGCRGPIEINPRDLMTREADIRGVQIFNCDPLEWADIHAGLAEGLENGALRPVISRAFPLAEAAAAHRAVMEPGALGKIILEP